MLLCSWKRQRDIHLINLILHQKGFPTSDKTLGPRNGTNQNQEFITC